MYQRDRQQSPQGSDTGSASTTTSSQSIGSRSTISNYSRHTSVSSTSTTSRVTALRSSAADAAYDRQRRSPTDSSYYDLDSTPWTNEQPGAQTWINAYEVRQQVADSPATEQQPYPSPYYNREELALQANIPCLHHPITPGQTTAWQEGPSPGAVRSFYNGNDRTVFDVAYHDPKKAISTRRNDPFTKAVYVAAAPRTVCSQCNTYLRNGNCTTPRCIGP
ncbi:hypothetical protein BDV95DRAFT_599695 [Massariosphaeria phaeospora]|uniref:Uncharacterized protein n=1 Tax=Massariosphaeria phaeospora TaxID=100035 RepID=A0A7C8MBT7_9PLEO|nr:hypothetical protein BDV95DRAFT_599695 [Massariosphaeria phaeospora]